MARKTRKERMDTPRYYDKLIGGTITKIIHEQDWMREIHVLRTDGKISIITPGAEDSMYADVFADARRE